MVKIKIYTWSYCPFCIKAKSLLNDLGLEFEEILVEEKEKLDELNKKTNHGTVPQLFINNEFIGGYDNLIAKKNSGELDKLLNK